MGINNSGDVPILGGTFTEGQVSMCKVDEATIFDMFETEKTEGLRVQSGVKSFALAATALGALAVDMYATHRFLMANLPQGADNGQAYLLATLMTVLTVLGTYVASNGSIGDQSVTIEGKFVDDEEEEEDADDYDEMIAKLKEAEGPNFPDGWFDDIDKFALEK